MQAFFSWIVCATAGGMSERVGEFADSFTHRFVSALPPQTPGAQKAAQK